MGDRPSFGDRSSFHSGWRFATPLLPDPSGCFPKGRAAVAKPFGRSVLLL